ncbi:MAG: hypothetical protein P8079_02005 [Gammaproteobacteria bacterium]|jgi:hypothetical protein
MKEMLVMILVLSCHAVSADCTYNGRQYPVGTVVNGYICTADGRWKPANLWSNFAVEYGMRAADYKIVDIRSHIV